MNSAFDVAKKIGCSLLPSWRTLRVSTYATCAFGVVAFAAARTAVADLREAAFGVSHQLRGLEDLTGDASTIRLNGATMHRASTHSRASVHDVLDRYEAYCRGAPSALAQAMRDIPQNLDEKVPLPATHPLRAGVIRQEKDGRGLVACFVDETSASGGPALEARLKEFLRTGDVAKIGNVRYVYAETSDGGSYVTTVWTDGELNPKKMFPARGDAPGDDSLLAPRPEGARRTLSASAVGTPYAVHIYETAMSREDVGRHYDASLSQRGFTKAVAANAKADAPGAAWVRQDGAEVIVSYKPTRNGASVTLVEAKGSPVQGLRVEVP